MAPSFSTPPKRIFIIGPMGKNQTDAQGLSLAEHIPNIEAAAQRVLRRLREKLGTAMPEVQVISPPDAPDGIPHQVFSHIMHCDFAIADISTASPNVMYELAMLHANGVPVILLGAPIFYLNQDNCLEVADFKTPTIEAALAGRSFDPEGREGHLEHLLLAHAGRTYWNPITRHFDGVHLVNVAAATGIATGYFHNFLSYVLKEGGIFKSRPEIIDIVLVRPTRIKDVDRSVGLMQQKFGKVLTDRDGNPVLEAGIAQKEIPDIMHHDPAHPRNKFFVRRVGNHLVDYPSPISSLAVSRQYIDTARYLREHSVGFSDDELPPFETRLIDIYFDTLHDLSNKATPSCDWARVKVMTVDEALIYLET